MILFTCSTITTKATVNQTLKFCMYCKGLKTTLTPEGTPYACKYCNGTGVLSATKQINSIKKSCTDLPY